MKNYYYLKKTKGGKKIKNKKSKNAWNKEYHVPFERTLIIMV